MEIEFDPAKDAENRRKHSVSLARAEDFDLVTARIEVDTRKDYGEPRVNALGLLGGVLHSLTFTPRGGKVRPISLRIANRKERRVYANYRDEEAP